MAGKRTRGHGLIEDEARCSVGGGSGEESDYELTDAGPFIDDTPPGSPEPGSSGLQLFVQQQREVDARAVQGIKRKCIDEPDRASLTPRLSGLVPSLPTTPLSKRSQAGGDSGIQDEAASYTQAEQVTSEVGDTLNRRLLAASNIQATQLSVFKTETGVSFRELTRVFKSDRTTHIEWVMAVFHVHENMYNAFRVLITDQCTYCLTRYCPGTGGSIMYGLFGFRAQKCRRTVLNLVQQLMKVGSHQVLADPPKCRSVPAALFWYRASMHKGTGMHGQLPDWVVKQTLAQHVTGDASKFDLSTMVQWAYDNDLTTDHEVAYQYALMAPEDTNAAAWLSSNAQAKHVRDCVSMVRLYKRAEMDQMTMSAWVYKRCARVREDGSWRVVLAFLRHQGVEIIAFLGALGKFLRGIPKRNCIAVWGPPNSGKSYFCTTLTEFLGGSVLSFVNSQSHFWLQPLTDSKVALLDDATRASWDYMDTYMRNGLDGNKVSIDRKHRHPVQMKFPPLLVTSNIDVAGDPRWKYLHSRVTTFHFPHDMPFTSAGRPLHELTNANWKSFFERFWQQLELSDQEDSEDDGSRATFRCAAGPDPGAV